MPAIQKVIKRSGAVVDFIPNRITNAIYRAAVAMGGRDKDRAEALSKQVIAILEEQTPEGKYPTIEEIQDVVEKVLIENGHAKVAKAYILYRDERARGRAERAEQAYNISETIPWAKIWKVLDWAVDQGVNTISGYNERLAKGELPDVVAAAEAAYEEDIENVAEMIIRRKDDVRMAIISGPSSSGKTTSTIKVGKRLEHVGLKLVSLNIDHYFFNLEMHPKDEFGDYDFETPQALDMELINTHLKKLLAGEKIMMPYYDFKTGQRQDNVTPMQLESNEIILIDSLYGLYPAMTEDISHTHQFRLYLEPLLQMKDSEGQYIRWTDIRLMRRMLRDAAHRAYDPKQTLTHWHYVRSGEKRNILPYMNTADYIINSAMPEELSIYRHRLYDGFMAWEKEFEGDPIREDAYTRAARTRKMLSEFTPIEDDSIVPNDSVIREFIGGSIYDDVH